MVLFSFLQRKVAIYGLTALAVLLIVCGIYRAGGKAANAATLKKSYDRCIKQMKVKQNVENRINKLDANSIDKLRRKWTKAE